MKTGMERLPQGPSPPRRGLPSPCISTLSQLRLVLWRIAGHRRSGHQQLSPHDCLERCASRTKVYGWVEPTLNFSTSTNSNAPVANDVYSNRLEMNQLIVYVERLPDSVQREHVDIGYHLTAFYGTDYRTQSIRAISAANCWCMTISTASIRSLNTSTLCAQGSQGDEYPGRSFYLHPRNRSAAYAQ